MTLAAPLGLLALAVIGLLVLAHLRRRSTTREVASLLLWTEGEERAVVSPRRRFAVVLPWLLALQALAVVALAVALARPERDEKVAAAPVEVFVVDTSVAMRPADRLPAARAAVEARLRTLPAGTRAALVAPGVVVAPTADRGRIRAAVAGLRAGYGTAELGTALRVAGGLLTTARDHVVVLHAREDAVPRTRGVAVSARAVGVALDDQSIEDPVARCAPAAPTDCRLYADVRNDGDGARTDVVEVRNGARVLVRQSVRVGAHARTGIVLRVPAGARLSVAIAGAGDGLPEDDAASVVVPAATSAAVTLVSDAGRTSALARALAAVPGVRLRLMTPAAYRSSASRACDVLVLDRVAVPTPAPAVPGLVEIASPPLGPALADPAVTTTADGDPLLAGVDLTGLSIDAGAARRLAPPAALHAVVSAAGGPLVSAGTVNGQRVVMLAFDPRRSMLPGLAAFPTLIANMVAWGRGATQAEPLPAGSAWAVALPAGTTGTITPGGRTLRAPAGGGVVPVGLDTPGLTTVTEHGAWGTRAETVAVTVAAPAAAVAPAPVALHPAGRAQSADRSERWRWFVTVALAILAAEVALARRLHHSSRVVAA